MAPNAKRSGQAAASAVAKKVRVAKVAEDPVVTMCRTLAEGLEMAELPEVSRATFAAMIPYSIGAPRNQRHKHQEAVVEMLESAMKGIEARLAGLVAERQGELDGVKAEKEELQSAWEAAKAKLAAKLMEVEELKAAHRDCFTLHEERAAALEAARAGQAEAAAKAACTCALKEKCDGVIAGPLALLQAGHSADSAEVEAHAAELVTLGRELGLDESMICGLPMAVAKKPEERGSFDAMIVQNYEAELRASIASLEGSLLGLEAAQAERATETQTAEDLLAVAREALQNAGDAVTTAEAAAAEIVEQDKSMKKDLESFAPKLKTAQSARSRDDGELHAFLTTYMSTFEVLRDREVEGESTAVAA